MTIHKTLTLTGTRPLMVNSPQTVSPFHPISQAKRKLTGISSAKRTPEQDLELLRLSWLGGLYHKPETGPYLPATCIFESIRQAAALSRRGKDVERGVVLMQMEAPILYDGPRDPEEMWAVSQGDGSQSFVDIRDASPAGKRIIVARPIFYQWSLTVDVALDPSVIAPESFDAHAEKAGELIGIGTYRKLFGRYEIAISDAKSKGVAA